MVKVFKRETRPRDTAELRRLIRLTTVMVECDCNRWPVTTLFPVGKCGACGSKVRVAAPE